MKRVLPFPSRRLLATLLATVCLLCGALVVSRWTAEHRPAMDGRMAYWQTLLTDLDRDIQQDRSFRPAYAMLAHTINMVETVQAWREIGSTVEVTPELRSRLESAYLAATARARSATELRQLQQLESRYERMMRLLEPQATGTS